MNNPPKASIEMASFNNVIEAFDCATNFQHDQKDLPEIVSWLSAQGHNNSAEYFVKLATAAGVLDDSDEQEGCAHDWKLLGLDRDGNTMSECRKCGELWEQ